MDSPLFPFNYLNIFMNLVFKKLIAKILNILIFKVLKIWNFKLHIVESFEFVKVINLDH
jgi:hypothetical protein